MLMYPTTTMQSNLLTFWSPWVLSNKRSHSWTWPHLELDYYTFITWHCSHT